MLSLWANWLVTKFGLNSLKRYFMTCTVHQQIFFFLGGGAWPWCPLPGGGGGGGGNNDRGTGGPLPDFCPNSYSTGQKKRLNYWTNWAI